MFFKKVILSTIIVGLYCVGSIALASGGDDSGSEDAGSFGDDSGGFGEERVVDPIYESGKAVYTGRSKSAPKLSYCIGSGEQAIKLKRKSIKQFKKTSFSELAKNLYRCDVPSETIKSQLEKRDFLHMLYYLDKRYKLQLERV